MMAWPRRGDRDDAAEEREAAQVKPRSVRATSGGLWRMVMRHSSVSMPLVSGTAWSSQPRAVAARLG